MTSRLHASWISPGVDRTQLQRSQVHVAIYGNSGSGKSTLANCLGDLAQASVLDLDTIAWGETAVRAPSDVSRSLLEAFAATASDWIVEGCYGDLIELSLAFQPVLIFLNPGVEACVAHCRARPWEPHKYASVEEQNERLAFLIDWVRDYECRDDDMSLAAHERIFANYAGQKVRFDQPLELTQLPALAQSIVERFD